MYRTLLLQYLEEFVKNAKLWVFCKPAVDISEPLHDKTSILISAKANILTSQGYNTYSDTHFRIHDQVYAVLSEYAIRA